MSERRTSDKASRRSSSSRRKSFSAAINQVKQALPKGFGSKQPKASKNPASSSQAQKRRTRQRAAQQAVQKQTPYWKYFGYATVIIVSFVIVGLYFKNARQKPVQPKFVRSNDPVHAAADRDESGESFARVVNGKTANEGRYSYPVSLFAHSSTHGLNNFVCTGSLIAPDTVLTAAHCLGTGKDSICGSTKSGVMIGAFNIEFPEEGSEFIEIAECITHPQYSSFAKGFDVGLVKLKKASKHLPVWLDNGKSTISNNEQLTVMGWGATGRYAAPNQLMELELKYLDSAECANKWKELSVPISASHLCARHESKRHKQTYYGDSGGPLVLKSLGTNQYQDIQVGIVSFGLNNFSKHHFGFPEVYARVSEVAGWIKDNTRNVRFASINERRNSNWAFSFRELCILLVALLFGYMSSLVPVFLNQLKRNRGRKITKPARNRQSRGIIPPPHDDEKVELKEMEERKKAAEERKYGAQML